MKIYATKSQQDRLDRFYIGALLDLSCYLKPGTKDWVRWIVDTHEYRHTTREERMTKIATEQSIETVKRKGPEKTSTYTLAKALGCELEYRGHHCYVDGMVRTLDQAHEHLIALWNLIYIKNQNRKDNK